MNEYTRTLLDLLKVVVGYVIGSCATLLTMWLKDRWNRAKLEFSDDVIFHPFSESVSVLLEVKHIAGSLPATNAMGLLTINYEGLGEKEDIIPQGIVIEKENGKCIFKDQGCNRCGCREYLVPYSSFIKVHSEPLPWTMPIDSGEGLIGLPYKHLTNIPVNGLAKLVLFDIYKAIFKHDDNCEEKFYLVKVHSEYGNIHHPRVCFKLSLEKPITGKLVFTINVASENIRGKVETRLHIKYDEPSEDYILQYKEKMVKLSNILKDKKELHLRRKGRHF